MSNYWQKWGKFKLRHKEDDLPQSWWFASTVIPILAACIGPLANVLSLASLVTKWKDSLPDNGVLPAGADNNGIPIPDSHWEITINALSLAFGFIGNFFLLCNFTRRVRYVIALPLTVVLWSLASTFLLSILIATAVSDPPVSPGETWSQGFWHAVIACSLYFIGFAMLLINLLGYLLGKYPQNFDLNDNQRTLILQTMLFFIWLAGGAAVFSAVCGFSYANSLYFCDVTILTVGFGDFVPTNNAGRGIIMPYSVLGIISLGLVINSIHKFGSYVSKVKITKAHTENLRISTISRSVANERQLRARLGLPANPHEDHIPHSPQSQRADSLRSIERYGELNISGQNVTFQPNIKEPHNDYLGSRRRTFVSKLLHPFSVPIKSSSKDEKAVANMLGNVPRRISDRRQKLILLRSERERFSAMREIQNETRRFRRYYHLSISVVAFGILWCCGALVFWKAEQREQGMSYFEALYFSYVSLLTIGYGDFAPRSNAGKAFFIFWSLVAVPTITLLVNNMCDTVISGINHVTSTVADWTIMPRLGVFEDFVNRHPKLKNWVGKQLEAQEEKQRIEAGFPIQDPDEEAADQAADTVEHPTIEKIAGESLSNHELIKRLALSIKKTAQDMHIQPPKRYSYEEWAEFTRLIRFTAETREELLEEEVTEGLIEWDWIGEDSPMLSDVTEPEWILDRLIESLKRYTAKEARKARHHQKIASLHKTPKKHDQSHHEAEDGAEWASAEEILDPKKQTEMEMKEPGPGGQQTTRNSWQGGREAPQQASNNLHGSDEADEPKRQVSKNRKFTKEPKDKKKQEDENEENEEKEGSKKQR